MNLAATPLAQERYGSLRISRPSRPLRARTPALRTAGLPARSAIARSNALGLPDTVDPSHQASLRGDV